MSKNEKQAEQTGFLSWPFSLESEIFSGSNLLSACLHPLTVRLNCQLCVQNFIFSFREKITRNTEKGTYYEINFAQFQHALIPRVAVEDNVLLIH